MKTQGFKCNACGTGFEDVMPEDSQNGEVKCPHCSGTDVSESEEVLKFLELVDELGRTGG